MKTKLTLLMLFFCSCFYLKTNAQSIRINELVSSNSIYLDEDWDTPDWIELYNYGNESVSLEGWSLSDDVANPSKWAFPGVTMAPDSYLRIWASKKDRLGIFDNLHTNFKISSGSETIILSNNLEVVIDQITAENLPPDVSLGVSRSTGNLVNFIETTPEAINSVEEFLGTVTSTVLFSHGGGTVNGPVSLVLSGNSPGETIRYTTNASVPTENDLIYTNPIAITDNTVVRARIFKSNYISSTISNKSFIFNSAHELDMIFLTTEPKYLFDEDIGMMVKGKEGTYETEIPFKGANFWEEWEYPMHFAFYEHGNAKPAVEYDAGGRIFGNFSRANDQKSLALFARGKYGFSEFEHSFFDELEYNDFQSFVLRNSGGDFLLSNIKDMTLSSLLRGSEADFQESNSVATYINGAYWGMYNMREKVNKHMLASKHNVDADDITILVGEKWVVTGSSDHQQEYIDLIDYITNTDLSTDENFEYVNERIDFKNYNAYQLSNLYFGNLDWPGNNMKYWKHNNGKWRWITFDLDYSYGVWKTFPSDNHIAFALEENGPDWPNPPWSTLLFRRLNTNLNFRNAFINSYADELNTRFLPENVKSHIESTLQKVNSELLQHYERWNGNTDNIKFQIDVMRNWAELRAGFAKEHLLSTYELPSFHAINISNNDSSKGFVKVNDNLKIQESTWTGDYFETVPIALTAIAETGYEFTNWSGDIQSTNATININLVAATNITANFSKITSQEKDIVINEINYKSGNIDANDWIELYNPGPTAINISNWKLKDDDDTHIFNIPAGTILEANAFIVLVKNTEDFTLAYPTVTNFIGDIDFGFGKQDSVRLFNDQDLLQDQVDYSSDAPWPICADGTGQTLELSKPELDNNIAENWSCINVIGSPGAINEAPILSTDDRVLNKIKIYPNPVDAVLHLSGISNLVSIQIYTITGQEVYLKDTVNSNKINVQHLQKGFYLIKIKDEKNSVIHKFVKK